MKNNTDLISFSKNPKNWNKSNIILLMLDYIEECEHEKLFTIGAYSDVKTTKTLEYCIKLFKKYFKEIVVKEYEYTQVLRGFASVQVLHLKLTIDNEIWTDEYKEFILTFFKLRGKI